MRRLWSATTAGALILAVALAGCGQGSSSPNGPEIALASPALEGQRISAHYTCDGVNASPPLEWSAIPATTKELVLFLFDVTPQVGTPGQSAIRARLSVQWVVAGLKPALHEMAEGKLPPGAVLGRNREGHQRYSLCPAKGGGSKTYLFRIYALARPLALRPGFNGLGLLRQIDRPALESGQLVATYARA
jgi:phosphatidylethanolamine-binding protein (PEBP) family uncharacterized protein